VKSSHARRLTSGLAQKLAESLAGSLAGRVKTMGAGARTMLLPAAIGGTAALAGKRNKCTR
jgi:hypothetical protein